MLKKKLLVERASLLKQNKGSLVLAATKAHFSGKEIAHMYACTACDSEFSSNPDSEPYCVNCGSDHVEQMPDATSPEIPQTDESMVAVRCHAEGCGTYNIVHEQTAALLDGVMHCVTCGTSLAYNNEFNAGGDHPADTRAPETKATQPDARPEEKPATPADTRPAKEEPIAVQHADTEDGDGDQEGGDSVSDDDRPWRNQQESDLDDVTETEPLDDNADEIGLEQSQGADDFVDPQEVEQDDGEPVPVALSSVVLANNKKATFGLIVADDRVHATLGGIHVATLRQEEAGEYATVLRSNSFARAVQATVASEGYDNAMAHYGFRNIVLQFPQGKVNAALVAKRVKESAALYHDKADEVKADYNQCITLAAAGLARNFFSKQSNVLRDGFVQALTAAGIRGADKITAGVFERYSDDYHRVLFEVASNLMNKSVEVRNELATAIQQINPGVIKSSNEQEQEDEDGDNMEDHMEQSGRRVETEVSSIKRQVSYANNVSSIADLRQAAGGSLFNR
jgi:hypothetical protein